MTPEQKLEAEIKNHYFGEYYAREQDQNHATPEKCKEATERALDAAMPELVERYFNPDFWSRRKAEMLQLRKVYNDTVQKAERDFQGALAERGAEAQAIEKLQKKFASPKS